MTHLKNGTSETVNLKPKATATLQQATETTTDQTLSNLLIGKFGTQPKQIPNQQPKSRSNLKWTVNLRGQAQKPGPMNNTEKAFEAQRDAMTANRVTQVLAETPEIPAQMMILSHPFGTKTPYGDIVLQLLPDRNHS
jgi:hypothetical protein